MASKIHESLDTNIILRLILQDIPEQSERATLLLMRPDRIYDISDLAITETVYVLQKDYSRPEIIAKLAKFFELPYLNANFNLFNQVFPLYLSHPKLSFNDCCLSVYAALNNAEPLWTFDHALAHQSPSAQLLH